ncbi:MAG: Flp pilus assembly complex ATPase component TadA [Lentisphaerae bacterium]|jgi:type IV pilus assembly protein PilB|nr:Flp pilus assembly complex ATPase component TadA [Lentisphaerota bacterium]MBT4819786.1 Flp pilus assembly complex ATPase component TadA [Lentisphaerota bacterium]MBT5607740.1 Flp pilus assembly complex ATPase component TadA [Lentisphaerota bacterium]MBT7054903.1 Flp pilus assembly complex ATPase component TadA [Lentisphaerota bacterium]MBT7843327.1 Flp pilus assembly complex ATPase component TadA [Lentisphaerota bacterium]
MANIEIDADSSAIWHLLLDAGKATEEQLADVYEEHERTGRTFTTVLYNYDIIKEEELLGLIADNLGTEVVDIKEGDVDHSLIEKVGASIARVYEIIPVRQEGETLFVAAKDPMNYRMIDELHYVIGQECRILVAKPADIDDALDHFYPERSDSVKDILAEMEGAEVTDEGFEDDEQALEAMASNAPIVRFVDVILYQAVKDQASDVHFEPFVDEFRIRYRIDGALYEMAPPPRHLAVPVISRIKVLSNLNIAERRVPQDGRIEMRIGGKPIDLRVSTLPTQYGESVVLRVLDRSVVDLNLDKLGMPEKVLQDVREVIHRPNGIFVVTGPTGCGKTTTLYSGLKEINTIGEKLLTAEDPVEYDLEGIMQVGVRESVGMTFASALRAFLRQDPDRIMVGEVRDLQTASMAIQAALTGHLVLSTLHTNDAPGAVTRLIDMGVEPFLISSTVAGILGQRLIRRICTNCKTEYEPKEEELEMLNLTAEDIGENKFFYGKGCELCNNTGYKGRIGIYEFLKMSLEVEDMINQRMPTSAIRTKAIEEGMVGMRENGIRIVLDGISTAEEVLKYT